MCCRTVLPPTEQVQSLKTREMTIVNLTQLEPADGVGKAELLNDGVVLVNISSLNNRAVEINMTKLYLYLQRQM